MPAVFGNLQVGNIFETLKTMVMVDGDSATETVIQTVSGFSCEQKCYSRAGVMVDQFRASHNTASHMYGKAEAIQAMFHARLAQLTGEDFVPTGIQKTDLAGYKQKYNDSFKPIAVNALASASHDWLVYLDPIGGRPRRAQRFPTGTTLFPGTPTGATTGGDGIPQNSQTQLGFINPFFKKDTYVLFDGQDQPKSGYNVDHAGALSQMVSARLQTKFDGTTTAGTTINAKATYGICSSARFLVKLSEAGQSQASVNAKSSGDDCPLQSGGVTFNMGDDYPRELHPNHEPMPSVTATQAIPETIGNSRKAFVPLRIPNLSQAYGMSTKCPDINKSLGARILNADFFHTSSTCWLSDLMEAPIPETYSPGQQADIGSLLVNVPTSGILPTAFSTKSNYDHHNYGFTDVPDKIVRISVPCPISTVTTGWGFSSLLETDSNPPYGGTTEQAVLDLINLLTVRVVVYSVCIAATRVILQSGGEILGFKYSIDAQEQSVPVSTVVGRQGTTNANQRYFDASAPLTTNDTGGTYTASGFVQSGSPLYFGNPNVIQGSLGLNIGDTPAAVVPVPLGVTQCLPNPLSGEVVPATEFEVFFRGRRDEWRQYVGTLVHMSIPPLSSLMFTNTVTPHPASSPPAGAGQPTDSVIEWTYLPPLVYNAVQNFPVSTIPAGATAPFGVNLLPLTPAGQQIGNKYYPPMTGPYPGQFPFYEVQPAVLCFRWEPSVTAITLVRHIQRGDDNLTVPFVTVKGDGSEIAVTGMAYILVDPKSEIVRQNSKALSLTESCPNVQMAEFTADLWDAQELTDLRQAAQTSDYLQMVLGWMLLTTISIKEPVRALNLLKEYVASMNYKPRMQEAQAFNFWSDLYYPTKNAVMTVMPHVATLVEEKLRDPHFRRFIEEAVLGIMKARQPVIGDAAERAVRFAEATAGSHFGGGDAFARNYSRGQQYFSEGEDESDDGGEEDQGENGYAMNGDDGDESCAGDEGLDEHGYEAHAWTTIGNGNQGRQAGMPPLWYTAGGIRAIPGRYVRILKEEAIDYGGFSADDKAEFFAMCDDIQKKENDRRRARAAQGGTKFSAMSNESAENAGWRQVAKKYIDATVVAFPVDVPAAAFSASGWSAQFVPLLVLAGFDLKTQRQPTGTKTVMRRRNEAGEIKDWVIKGKPVMRRNFKTVGVTLAGPMWYATKQAMEWVADNIKGTPLESYGAGVWKLTTLSTFLSWVKAESQRANPYECTAMDGGPFSLMALATKAVRKIAEDGIGAQTTEWSSKTAGKYREDKAQPRNVERRNFLQNVYGNSGGWGQRQGGQMNAVPAQQNSRTRTFSGNAPPPPEFTPSNISAPLQNFRGSTVGGETEEAGVQKGLIRQFGRAPRKAKGFVGGSPFVSRSLKED